MIKSLRYRSISIVCIAISGILVSGFVEARIPNPTRDFFKYMDTPSKGSDVALYDPKQLGIDSTISLKDNIRLMFYPGATTSKLWSAIKMIGGIILFIFIIVIGVQFMINADDESKITNAKNSFIYLMYGAFLVFGSMWILNQLNIEGSSGGQDLMFAIKDKIVFNFIAFIKAMVFFVAIIMIIYYGLEIIRAYDKDDKIKTARTGIINVIGVLVLIKIIDYVYFIAYDTSFKTKAVDLIVQVSKLLGWAIGVVSVLYVIYAGFLLVVGGGESDRLKKATSIIKAIFFGVLIVFLFLLTIYQLFKDLG